MKGTLVKQGGYKLYVNDIPYATSDNSPYKRLSLKNCEAIANGYDLDELAKQKYDPNYVPSMFINFEIDCKREGFIEGAKAILELFADKKFSEDDIKKRVELVKEQFREDVDAYGKPKKIMSKLDTIYQSLQQLEWSVEVEMEENCPYDYTSRCNQGRCDCKRPKVDKNGCLILKRVTL